MRRVLFFATMFCALLYAPTIEGRGVVKVIFDTDMGNDIDDALALDMLYKYQTPCKDGKHHIMTLPDGGERVVDRFVEIIGKTKMNRKGAE